MCVEAFKDEGHPVEQLMGLHLVEYQPEFFECDWILRIVGACYVDFLNTGGGTLNQRRYYLQVLPGEVFFAFARVTML